MFFIIFFFSILFHLVSSSPPPSVFSTDWGIELLRLTAVAWCNTSTIPQWKCKTCKSYFPDFQFISSVNSSFNDYGFMGIDHSRQWITLSFRGSVNGPNWIENLLFWKSKACWWTSKDCQQQVHSGWNLAFHEMEHTVNTHLGPLILKYPDYSIIVTGHSLGAAHAEMFAVNLATTNYSSSSYLPSPDKLRNVYLFGMGTPRVGNPQWADHVQSVVSQYVRVIHHHDIVPMVPLQVMGFHHPPREYWYYNGPCTPSSCPFTACSTFNGEDPNCSDQIPLWEGSPDDHGVYLGHFIDCDAKYVG